LVEYNIIDEEKEKSCKSKKEFKDGEGVEGKGWAYAEYP